MYSAGAAVSVAEGIESIQTAVDLMNNNQFREAIRLLKPQLVINTTYYYITIIILYTVTVWIKHEACSSLWRCGFGRACVYMNNYNGFT